LQITGLTNQGLERTRNEDNCFVQTDNDIAMMVVADGMGGHLAGNVASALAVNFAEQLWEELDRTKLPSVKEARDLISRLINEANRIILSEAGNSSALRGMGTTLTAGLLSSNRLTIGHVGDSRAYQIKNGEIKLLTKDHSLLEHLIESGQVDPDDAFNHPQRHILTRALGISADLELDIIELELEKGSMLLFCTDGLTNLVRDDEILAICSEHHDSRLMAEALVDLANARGGLDNITVVLVTEIGGQKD